MPTARHKAPERSRSATWWSLAVVFPVVLTLAVAGWWIRDASGPSLSSAAADVATHESAAARVELAWTTPVKQVSRAQGRKAKGKATGKATAKGKGQAKSRFSALAEPVARTERDSELRAEKERERRALVKARKRAEWRAKNAPFTINIATFNVLGSQHSAPGGDRRNFAPASVRSARAVGYIQRHGADIVGTQELQADQLRQITGGTGMAAYPGLQWGEVETDNSILYDAGKYEFVSGDSYSITFVGRSRPQPILRLRDRATGREFYVLNTHTSPGGGRAAGERYNAHAETAALMRSLHAETGLPVLVTGDMNDREQFFCRVVAPGGLTTPQGGSYSGGCAPPAGHLAVDWVAGVGIDSWSDYWMDTSSVANKTSDHFVVSATAHVG